MRVNVVGYRKSSFKTNDGSVISGYQIFLATPINENGEGVSVDRAFVTQIKCVNPPKLGPADVEYNRYGKIEHYTSVSK